MLQSRILRGLCWCMLGWLLAIAAHSQTMPTEALDLSQRTHGYRAYGQTGENLRILALQNLSASSTPDEAFSSKNYQAFQAEAVYDLSVDKALWLRLKIKTDPLAQLRWSLRFDKTFLDRIEFYYRDTQGQWQLRQAGDHIAHAQWSQRTLFPQFDMPTLPSGEHTILIKIVQNFSMQIPVTLIETSQAVKSAQEDFLLSGVLIGVLGVIFVLALHLAVSYKDVVYVWYSVYVLLSLLACTTFLGSASYVWWPYAQAWPEYSILSLVLGATIAQLWFCQAMFLRQTQAVFLKRSAQKAAIVCGLLALLSLTPLLVKLPTDLRIGIFACGMVVCLGLIFAIVALALRDKLAAANYWLVAYTPLVAVVIVLILENFTAWRVFELPYSTPAFTLVFEAIVLLFALNLHAKDRHAVLERARTMGEVDPLTGFLSPSVFNARLAAMWYQAILGKQDMTLAFIQVHHSGSLSDPQSVLRLEAKLLRSVRHLRTITRDVDLIGRIGGNLIAVAMPQIPIGEQLNNRLSRLVALGLMADPYDTTPMELRFRVAVSTRDTWGEDLKSLETVLRNRIALSSGWSRRPIQYINAESGAIYRTENQDALAPKSSQPSSVGTSSVPQT